MSLAMIKYLSPLALGLCALPFVTTAAFAEAPDAVSDAVSQDRLRADVEALVGFGTRHTLSSQTDARRGIGAARRWAEDKSALSR